MPSDAAHDVILFVREMSLATVCFRKLHGRKRPAVSIYASSPTRLSLELKIRLAPQRISDVNKPGKEETTTSRAFQ